MKQPLEQDSPNWKKWYSIMITVLILVIIALVVLGKLYN
jgi:hypothetical protein